MEEVDDVQKQIRAIRSLEQLKICDLHYFDYYVDLFYKYWSQIGRPYDEELLMKFVTKLPGKIGEKLYKDLTEWFKSRKEEGLLWQISLLPTVEFIRQRIRELCDEEKLRRQAQQQFNRMCVDLYEVPTLGCGKTRKYKNKYNRFNKEKKKIKITRIISIKNPTKEHLIIMQIINKKSKRLLRL